jgi:nucleotide-binding universal stress UspA family protein
MLVVDDAAEPSHVAFEEAARIAQTIPLAGVHILYLSRRHHTDHSGLRGESVMRAEALGIRDRLIAVHLRLGDPAAEIIEVARDVGASLVVLSGRPRWLSRKRVVDAIYTELGCPVVLAVGPPNVPEIEPPCPACVAMRAHTGDRVWWCHAHDHRHPHAHRYSYRREIPLAFHDSNVIPTGIAF